MAFPVNARYEARVAGTTTVKAAWGNAVDDSLIGIYGGGKTLVSVEVDGTGNQAATASAGDVKASGSLIAIGGNVVANSGNITASAGNIRATSGEVRGNTVKADAGMTVTAGGLTVSAGGASITGTVSLNGQTQLGGNDLIATGDIRPNTNNAASIGTALLAYKRSYVYQYAGNVQTIPAAASITIDPTAGETVRITLSATTINAVTISAGLPGQILDVLVIQDGTGNRGIAGSAGANVWTNVYMSAAYVVSTGANKRDLLSFRYDSTSSAWYERSRSMNMG